MVLSAKQENILKFIRDFSDAHGYPPSIREIGQSIGISSTSVVNYNLLKLEKEGRLSRYPTISRGIRLSGPPPAHTNDGDRFRVPMVGTIVASKPFMINDNIPVTITGSIGVILHSYNYRGLMDKVGLRPQTYKSGKHKDMLSGDREPEIPGRGS